MARTICVQAPALIGQAAHVPAHDAFARLHAAVWESAGPVELAPPDACYLDLRHVQRAMNAGELGYLHALRATIQRCSGLHVLVGVGGGKFSARIATALAEAGGVHVIAPGNDAAALAPLPVTVLPAAPELLHRLDLLGIRTLGEFTSLPFGPVQAQFGTLGARLWRLAAGCDDEPVITARSASEPTERLEFPTPTADRAALQRAAVLLLRRLFRHADVGNRHARRLRICIELEDESYWERTIAFHTPAGTHEAAATALRPRLDALDLPAAAVALVLSLCDLCGEHGLQPSLFSAHVQRLAQLDAALQQLRARLGAAHVSRIVAVERRSRLPERRAALVEWTP